MKNSINPAATNDLNMEYTARAMKYTQPKDMTEVERDCHIAIRNQFRVFIEETGAPSVNKATVDQLRSAIEQTCTYVRGGVAYDGGKKLSTADQVVVAAWALRFECNVVAKAEEITVLRAIEKYVIADFDFSANVKRKAEQPVKATRAKAQPVEDAPPAEVGNYVERLDLNLRLSQFAAGDPPAQVQDLLNEWGDTFRLMVKRTTAMGNQVKALNEADERQTLVLLDINGKKIGMAYMDKLAQYFVVMERNADSPAEAETVETEA